MPSRGGRDTSLWMMPWHPVRQELEFQEWVSRNSLPGFPPASNRRILISTSRDWPMETMERGATDEDRQEIGRRVKELRKALDALSSSRRILYLSAALWRRVEGMYPREDVEDAWEILGEVEGTFSVLEAAKIIFDAEEVEDGNGVGID